MGLERLVAFLRDHRRIALDTCVFIYQVDANPRYIHVADHIFAWVERPGHRAVTSTITMTELLVHPFRDKNQQRVAELYGQLSMYPNLDWITADLPLAGLAAQLRAQYQLKTADALQAASVIRAGVTGFVTNDRSFERVHLFDTLVLDDVL